MIEPWVADLRALTQQIPELHVNAFRWTSREQFQQAATRIGAEMALLDAQSQRVKLAELVARLGDGHSFVQGYFPLLGFVPKSFPLRLYFFADGLHVLAAARSHAQLLGARLERINGLPVALVFKRVSAMFPAENDMSAKAWTVYGMTAPAVLRAYGVMKASGPARFEFEQDGRLLDMDLAGSERDAPMEQFGQVLDPDWVLARPAHRPALRHRHPERAYWAAFEAPHGLLYAQFNDIRNRGSQGVLDFFAELARQAEAQPAERFVLDLRWNAGGETGMNGAIVKTLLASPVINRKDRFFVLIGRRTFSSAQLICTALEQYSQAIFVGETTGIRSHFFANTRRRLQLPHSQLNVFLSTNWWQPTNARDLQPGQDPQIAVAESFADHAQNRDPALEAVLAHPVGN
ncbi:MAG: hypothetical protein J0L58_16895 [Burkholderiales bacterium]|nr:hypothetical protein [Burkholderiales bacterium]